MRVIISEVLAVMLFFAAILISAGAVAIIVLTVSFVFLELRRSLRYFEVGLVAAGMLFAPKADLAALSPVPKP